MKKTKVKRAPGNANGRDRELREQLVYLLKGGGAHVHFEDALDDFPEHKRGVFAKGLPHTGWQLLEHMRIAQWDIVEFCRSAKHVSPPFPAGYWPKTPLPPDVKSWDKSVAEFKRVLNDLIRMVRSPSTDLHAKLQWGEGQTILREALLTADHNAYHLGEIVYLRRALGVWPQA